MSRPTIDCAVIIALREEFEGQGTFQGFQQFFDVEPQREPGPFQLFQFVDSQGSPRTGVAAVMESMTPLSAYETTRELLDTYAPTLLVNIGIAGALSKDLKLGDVIIADEIDLYDFAAKAIPSKTGSIDDFSFKWGGRHTCPSEDVGKLLGGGWRLPFYATWEQACTERLREGIAATTVQMLRNSRSLGDKNRFERGSIASGNVVGASVAFREELLRSRGRKLQAIEMESFGFLRAAGREGCKTLIIKAISDLADENKGELDSSTGSLVRAWAASNAFHLLSIACTQLLPFGTWGAAKSLLSVPADIQSAEGDKKYLLEFAIRHFKKQHKHLVHDIDASLALYDPLFRCVLPSATLPQSNLFDTFAAQVVADSSAYPLRVNGKPGVGKTTFLTLLYVALFKLSAQRGDAPIPVYVNLKRYITPEKGRELNWSPRAIADNDLAILRKFLGPNSSQNVIVLVDGIDEYARYDATLEKEFLDLVEQSSGAKKIVGVGLNYLAPRERFKRSLRRDLDNPQKQITLEEVDFRESNRVASLVSAFEATYPLREKGVNYREEVTKRAKSFGFKKVDLLTLSMLFDLIRENTRYEQAGTLSAFFQIYCESFLQAGAGNETLGDAARMAFEYTVKPGVLVAMDQSVHKRSWKLLHLHSNVRDFLVAWHAVHLVRSAASTHDAAKLADLNYVYPHNVNRFCKDIVNSLRDVQFEVLEGAKGIYREGGENAKPHAVYLAGRFSDSGAAGAAGTWIRDVCLPDAEELQKRDDSQLKPSELLLCRTIYISLAWMNDAGASEAYIKLLLERPQWNDINRGFHLEYYGDIPFDPERQLSHSDNLAPFPRTFQNLFERVKTNLSNRKYGLFNIEVFTLYSLAQYRHADCGLEDNVKVELLGLIPDLVGSRSLSETVRKYLKMLRVNFIEVPRFLPGRVAHKLYGLKNQLRAGWVDRKIALERVESVADHTMGALILGLIYLPEKNPRHWKDYDKERVLRYIMIHDLGEAIAGDVAPNNPDAARVKLEEREAYCYLNMVRTYPGVADLSIYSKLWEDFEARADVNANIARDIDKLENLVQLYLYQQVATISGYSQWKDELLNEVTTEAGKDILRIVQDYFES
jgi:nucleoside phosphorylase/5'-deoxynucleotidase YfbR-like HD superfamily hydrolase